MARAKITFEYNNQTGRRDIHIDYTSDPDALAHEHEKEHAGIVRELLGRGLITKEEADNVIIDRPEPEKRDKKTTQQEKAPGVTKTTLQ